MIRPVRQRHEPAPVARRRPAQRDDAGTQQMLLGTGVSVWRAGSGLLAVCLDQALDELVDVAGLGQLALV